MIVDSHAHVFRSPDQGRRQKEDYVIHEYGEVPGAAGVELIAEDGSLDDLVTHMRRAGVDRTFVLNLFAVRPLAGGGVENFYPGDENGVPVAVSVEEARAAMEELNLWCVHLAGDAEGVVPFIALDPLLQDEKALRTHLSACIEAGAKGVKLHSLTQGFHASDNRMWAAYEILQDAGLPVVAHSGSGRGPRARDAVPGAFAGVAEAFPRLKLVVAHLGGGAWSELTDFAARYHDVWFDCCEIIHWIGASNAPSAAEVSAVISEIGAERVMLGSDFPWYGLDDSVNRVLSLPNLTDDEKEMIVGGNAVRLLPL